MKETHYYLTMDSCFNGGDVYIDYNRVKGFKVIPKNNIKYDGIVVSEMVLINPSFIEKVLKKKIKRKLDTYLSYIIQILESTDDYGNLAVKNKIIFYLEYIAEVTNTVKEENSVFELKKLIYPYLVKIEALLKESEKNKVVEKLKQEVQYYLKSILILLEEDVPLKKVKVKLNLCYNGLFQILTMEEEDDGVIDMAINDLDRYRRTIMNKYRAFLDEHYVELLLKKIGVLERELRLKQVYKLPKEEALENRRKSR